MVMDADIQDVAPLVESADEPEISEDEAAPDEEVDETPDPIAELREQFNAVTAKNADLERLVRAETGRVQRLQNSLDAISQSSASQPQATPDPRLDDFDEVLGTMVDALSGSDIIDDQSKVTLRSLRTRLEQSRSTRAQARLRQELLDEMRQTSNPGAPQVAPEVNEQIAVLQSETAKIEGYATAKGVDVNTIPASELQFQPGETIEQAGARVRAFIDQLAQESQGVDDVAARRRAAGRGTPTRTGVAGGVEQDLARLLEDGLPMTDEAARKRAAAALGVEI